MGFRDGEGRFTVLCLFIYLFSYFLRYTEILPYKETMSASGIIVLVPFVMNAFCGGIDQIKKTLGAYCFSLFHAVFRASTNLWNSAI